MGSLGFGTFGIVRVWVPNFYFYFFKNLVWVRHHSYFSMICSSLFFFFFFFLCDFYVCVCDFERENKKSEIFVFVFGVLVATLVRLKNMILGFLTFCFWVSNLG